MPGQHLASKSPSVTLWNECCWDRGRVELGHSLYLELLVSLHIGPKAVLRDRETLSGRVSAQREGGTTYAGTLLT